MGWELIANCKGTADYSLFEIVGSEAETRGNFDAGREAEQEENQAHCEIHDPEILDGGAVARLLLAMIRRRDTECTLSCMCVCVCA